MTVMTSKMRVDLVEPMVQNIEVILIILAVLLKKVVTAKARLLRSQMMANLKKAKIRRSLLVEERKVLLGKMVARRAKKEVALAQVLLAKKRSLKKKIRLTRLVEKLAKRRRRMVAQVIAAILAQVHLTANLQRRWRPRNLHLLRRRLLLLLGNLVNLPSPRSRVLRVVAAQVVHPAPAQAALLRAVQVLAVALRRR